MDFESELESLRERKKKLEEEIEGLKEELAEKSASTREIRNDLEQWKKSVETGEVPEDDEENTGLTTRIPRVEVNPETGKPPRGARGDQIEQAINVISRRQDQFKAADLFEIIQDADPNFEENQRDYMYSKLNELKDEGKLEKVKRGTWTLAR